MATTELVTTKSEYKYLQWADELRRRIHNGEMQPGDQLPSQNEMRELHGVSRPTVERVYTLLEQEGLIIRERKRGIFVAPRGMRQLTQMIGFTGSGFSEKPRPRYWTHVQEGILEVAAREEQGVVLLNANNDAGWDKIDGVVLGDVINTKGEEIAAKIPTWLPRVSVLIPVEGMAGVTADDYLGGQLATEHLLKLGHRKIAYLGNIYHPLVKRRMRGYRDALSEAGIDPDPAWVRAYPNHYPQFLTEFSQIDCAAEMMQHWLEDDWHQSGCTAIFAGNDQAAAGIMKTLQAAGVKVPEQVSVVGFDNQELCDYTSPPLTSVEVQLYEIGVTALDILLRQIDTGKVVTATTVLPVRLKVRESTGPVPG